MRQRMMVVVALLALAGVAHADDWQDAATLDGLVGSYVGQPGSKIVYLTLAGTDGYHASGPFTRFVTGGRYNTISIQSGTYQAIGQNPAIGAIISFFDGAGNVLDSWWIVGIKRDPTGKKIIAIELDGTDGVLLQLYRVGL